MKTILTSLCFLFIHTVTIGQERPISLSIKGQYFAPKTTQFQSSFTGNSYLIINDSLALRSLVRTSTTANFNYKPLPGGEIMLNKDFTVKKNLFIQIGLGVNLTAFKSSFNLTDISRTVLSSDTVAFSLNNNEFENPCDTYTNDLNDIEFFDAFIRNYILNVKMPASLNYQIPNTRIRMGGGVFFQTPILSWVIRKGIGTEFHLRPDGMTECTWINESTTNNTGSSFKDFRWGLQASIFIPFAKRWAVEIQFSNEFSDVYVQRVNSNPLINSPSESVKAYQALLGVNYKLGKVKDEQNLNIDL